MQLHTQGLFRRLLRSGVVRLGVVLVVVGSLAMMISRPWGWLGGSGDSLELRSPEASKVVQDAPQGTGLVGDARAGQANGEVSVNPNSHVVPSAGVAAGAPGEGIRVKVTDSMLDTHLALHQAYGRWETADPDAIDQQLQFAFELATISIRLILVSTGRAGPGFAQQYNGANLSIAHRSFKLNGVNCVFQSAEFPEWDPLMDLRIRRGTPETRRSVKQEGLSPSLRRLILMRYEEADRLLVSLKTS